WPSPARRSAPSCMRPPSAPAHDRRPHRRLGPGGRECRRAAGRGRTAGRPPRLRQPGPPLRRAHSAPALLRDPADRCPAAPLLPRRPLRGHPARAGARGRAAPNAAGFFLGRTRLAACTARHRERGPYAYLDLDYWADPDRSVYRPQWTLEELVRAPNFTYLDRRFVRTFSEDERGVRVHATRADTGEEETHEAAALVLAGGTLGTARIVLASLGAYDRPVPILCNAYAYVPTLNLGMLR